MRLPGTAPHRAGVKLNTGYNVLHKKTLFIISAMPDNSPISDHKNILVSLFSLILLFNFPAFSACLGDAPSQQLQRFRTELPELRSPETGHRLSIQFILSFSSRNAPSTGIQRPSVLRLLSLFHSRLANHRLASSNNRIPPFSEISTFFHLRTMPQNADKDLPA